MKYKPMPGSALIQRDGVVTEENGILISTGSQERPTEGIVLDIGGAVQNKDGKMIPMSIKKGDRVFFTRHAGNKVQDPDNDDLWIIHEGFILAVLETK